MDIDSLRTDNHVNVSEPDSMVHNLSQIEPSGTDIHMDSSRLTTEIYPLRTSNLMDSSRITTEVDTLSDIDPLRTDIDRHLLGRYTMVYTLFV